MKLTIGSLTFSTALIQAPLAGYSCAPMRKLVHQWGGAAYACTEMLSAQHIFSGAKQKLRYSFKDPQEGLLCYQLAGNRPDVLAHAAIKACEWGADLIDLNCGCPQPKIRKKGIGSRLLSDSEALYQMVRAMKGAVSVPVTVKIRVDGSTVDNNNVSIAEAVVSAGADALIVHGRHWTERYDTPVSPQQIKQFVDTVSIPVIANGDVACPESAQALLQQTGAAGIMIARASLGQPWLFKQIAAKLNNEVFVMPSAVQVGDMLLQHSRELMSLEGEQVAILQSRKLIKYYARDLLADEITQPLNAVMTYQDLQQLVSHHFK